MLMITRDYHNKESNILWLLITCFALVLPSNLFSQGDKKYIRQGNREYEKDKFSESEISYRKAADKNAKSPDAIFNIGDALYKQNKYDDAGTQFIENHSMSDDREKKSSSLYNLGNSLLKANKVRESIDAYKGSLKLDPGNMEAKYNLAYAQDLLKEQEQEQEQQQQQQKDQNKDNQDNKKQDQEQKQKDQNKDQNNEGNQQEQQQQQNQEQQTISKEDAERILNALANDEKDVQEKVKLAKANKAKIRTVKNW